MITLNEQNAGFSKRIGHTATYVGNGLILVYGGYGVKGGPPNFVWILNLTSVNKGNISLSHFYNI